MPISTNRTRQQLGKYLQKCRKQAGLTQAAVAEKLGALENILGTGQSS